MFSLNDTMRYYLCPGPTCMRKGINGLCGVVHEQMGCDVKKAGRFRMPAYDPESKTYFMEWRDLVVMVEGIVENPQGRLRRLRAERTEYHV